ncbi:MAG: TolC family protein [Armatimonadetes bacterium]|nr:TolC family protein [Armatimonadota bacterium]
MIPIWTGLAALAAGVAQSPTLTLDEAMKIAEKTAFGVKIAETDLEKSHQRVREAEAQRGFKLTAGATYTRFDRALTSNFGGGDSVVVRAIDSKNANLVLNVPLLFSKTLGLGVEGAKLAVRASQASVDASKNELRLNVRLAYYRAVQAKWQKGVAEQALLNSKQRLANAEIRERAGELAKIDVLRFKTEVAQREGDLIAANNGLDLSKNALNNTLGRPVETPFETEEIPGVKPAVASELDLTALALKKRPDLDALRVTTAIQAVLRKIESHGTDPSLSLTVTHTRNIDAIGFGSTDAQTNGVLALSVPIVDAGLAKARTRQAAQAEEAAKIRVQQAELGVALGVRQAVTSLSNALAQLETATNQEALAAETYRLATVRYEAGEGIQLEIIDAQTQLTAAQTGLVAARYNVLIAYANLQAAIGIDEVPAAPRSGGTH